jgi:hypothetical protein
MKLTIIRSLFLASMLMVLPLSASAQSSAASVGGFGGLTLNGSNSQSLFGGNVAFLLTPNIQVVGEAGYINDLMPWTLDRLIALTPADVRLSALYGEGGVRFLGGSGRAAVRPYVEATAGMARLSTRVSGLGRTSPWTNAALGFLDRTSPLLGVGTGVVVGGGPIQLDIGYRYKRVMSDGALDRLFTGGDGISMNQVRVGLGIRF